MRVVVIFFVFVFLSGVVTAQETPTPTPEPTSTPLPDISVYGEIEGQPYRVDYVVSVGDVMVGTLLLLLLFSLWGLMVITVLDRD